MKRSLTVLACSCCLIGGALADEGVIDKTQSAVERGAEATVHGVKRGVEAAGHGIKRGAEAAGHGIEVGVSAAGRGIKRGADATGRAAHKVGEKLSPSSSASSDCAGLKFAGRGRQAKAAVLSTPANGQGRIDWRPPNSSAR